MSSSGTEKSSGSVSSSECCDVEVTIEELEFDGLSAVVKVSNHGCDLVFDAYTNNPELSVAPSVNVPLPGGEFVLITVTTEAPHYIDGSTLYIETDHCGIYEIYLGTTAPPPPEDP